MGRIHNHWRTLLICLLLAGSTLLVYWPVRHYDFLNWDDLTYVSTNDHVKGGLTWSGIAWAFTQSYSSNWHPLTWISHALDCQFFGLNAGAHHLVNLAFHIVNTLLLFALLRRMTGGLWRSAFVAALFALHPLHVESVAWVAERKDVLSAFFFFLTLLAYQKYVATDCTDDTDKNRNSIREICVICGRIFFSKWYVLALVLFALGLMSKPMLVTLPFVLLLLDFWPLSRWQRAEGKGQRTKGEGQRAEGERRGVGSSMFVLFRPSSIFHLLSSNRFLLLEKLPFLVLSAASCIVTFLAQQKGGAVATFEKLPFSDRIATVPVAYATYLLKFFWPADLSAIYPHPLQWPLWQVAGSVILLLGITLAAWVVSRRFPSLLTGWLWYLGMLVPVVGIVQVGSQAYADRYTYLPLIGVMVGVVWAAGGEGRRAKGENMKSEGRNPKAERSPKTEGRSSKEGRSQVSGFGLLALILVVLSFRTSHYVQTWRNTETVFSHALTLNPNNIQALYGLGTTLVEKGQMDDGKALLEKAISLKPNYPQALGSMGNLLDGQGRYADAIRFFEAALKAQPDESGALNNLAWLKATCADASFRDGAEAVRLAARACELTGYSKPLFIGSLAAAQAEAGDFQAAIATAERAAALADKLRLKDVAARNRELIELYKQAKPFHERGVKMGI